VTTDLGGTDDGARDVKIDANGKHRGVGITGARRPAGPDGPCQYWEAEGCRTTLQPTMGRKPPPIVYSGSRANFPEPCGKVGGIETPPNRLTGPTSKSLSAPHQHVLAVAAATFVDVPVDVRVQPEIEWGGYASDPSYCSPGRWVRMSRKGIMKCPPSRHAVLDGPWLRVPPSCCYAVCSLGVGGGGRS